VPRDSGIRPDHQRIKPVASHHKRISDFCTNAAGEPAG
jgi:hypothetical protein